MSESDRPADAPREQGEEDERLDDLEPAPDDTGAVKGGGPKDQEIQTGGGPTN